MEQIESVYLSAILLAVPRAAAFEVSARPAAAPIPVGVAPAAPAEISRITGRAGKVAIAGWFADAGAVEIGNCCDFTLDHASMTWGGGCWRGCSLGFGGIGIALGG
jgi:hypothetical protein